MADLTFVGEDRLDIAVVEHRIFAVKRNYFDRLHRWLGRLVIGKDRRRDGQE
jgi:hypothetical protein